MPTPKEWREESKRILDRERSGRTDIEDLLERIHRIKSANPNTKIAGALAEREAARDANGS